MDKPVYYDEDAVFCPYCKEDASGAGYDDGETGKVTCARCGGEFEYTVEVQYSFDIRGLKPGTKPTLDNPVKKKIVLENYEGKHIQEVDAEEIEIPGLEEFRFFLYINKWDWIVSEESTGMHLCADESRDAVMEKAKDLLSEVGKEKIVAAIEWSPKISEIPEVRT